MGSGPAAAGPSGAGASTAAVVEDKVEEEAEDDRGACKTQHSREVGGVHERNIAILGAGNEFVERKGGEWGDRCSRGHMPCWWGRQTESRGGVEEQLSRYE